MPRDEQVVPALMFHSVGLENHPWAWSHISESIGSFERKIELLRSEGFHSIFWSDLYDHMAGRRSLPKNSILLTFDDGYLDNWVYVYPLLRKRGMRGTIFVSPDFVDPAPAPRPNLDDVAARRCRPDSVQVPGFLSWAEMREMERSGVMDIQSHAMTHTWYFSGPEISNFHAPHSVTPNPWLFWNARPDRKPYYLNEDQQGFLPWGYPILEHRKALVVKRYFPKDGAIAAITEHVATHGGREFFRNPSWRPTLLAHVRTLFGSARIPGRFESDADREERIRWEVARSKELIEQNLGKTVDFICWPGGANDPTVHAAARVAGYKSWTLDSRSQARKRNRPGSDPATIKRIGTNNSIEIHGRRYGTAGPRYQLWRVLGHQGSDLHKVLLIGRKFAALASSLGRMQ